MIVKTRSAWMLILSAIKRDFDNTLTDTQKKAFVAFCDKKFKDYEISTETMGEIQTAVDMMTEFCKMNGIKEWKR
jgi:hypothetical protein